MVDGHTKWATRTGRVVLAICLFAATAYGALAATDDDDTEEMRAVTVLSADTLAVLTEDAKGLPVANLEATRMFDSLIPVVEELLEGSAAAFERGEFRLAIDHLVAAKGVVQSILGRFPELELALPGEIPGSAAEAAAAVSASALITGDIKNVSVVIDRMKDAKQKILGDVDVTLDRLEAGGFNTAMLEQRLESQEVDRQSFVANMRADLTALEKMSNVLNKTVEKSAGKKGKRKKIKGGKAGVKALEVVSSAVQKAAEKQESKTGSEANPSVLETTSAAVQQGTENSMDNVGTEIAANLDLASIADTLVEVASVEVDLDVDVTDALADLGAGFNWDSIMASIENMIASGVQIDPDALASSYGFDSFSDAVSAYNEAFGTSYTDAEALEALED